MKSGTKIFIEAFLLTLVVFIVGLYAGIVFEDNRVELINNYQLDSEVSLLDVISLDNLIDEGIYADCASLQQSNIKLLDKVYFESSVLDRYDEKQEITTKFSKLHKKYDAIRVYLWIDSIKIKEKCGDNFNTIVYLYNYSTTDLTKKAEQNVWSKVLKEIKDERGDNVILIPFAIDTDLVSLNSILDKYNITEYPAVIVNEKEVIRQLKSKEEILSLLN